MEDRIKTILKTSIVAIIVNVALGIFKAIVGVITKSIAITMDAVNNFTDAGSSFITIFSSYYAGKDPDKKHPFGYGRIEYLGTLMIACLILYAGVTSLVESVKLIINPQSAEYSTVSLMIIIVAVIAKACLTFYISKSGKKVKSDSLMASAKESIGDIAISIATVVAAFIYIYANLSVEAWLGAIIAILIVKTGIEILFETINKILGTGGDVELVKNVKKAIAAHEDVNGAYDLVLHNYGEGMYLASVHVEVNDTVSISRFDEITRELQNEIAEEFGIFLSAVGVYSVNTKDQEIVKIKEEVKEIALNNEFVNQMHGFYVDTVKKIMRFDLVISFDAKDRRIVLNEAVNTIKEKYPEYDISAGLDTDYNEI